MFSLSLKPGDILIFLKILLIFQSISVWVWNLFIDLVNNIPTIFHHLRKRKVYICSNCHIKRIRLIADFFKKTFEFCFFLCAFWIEFVLDRLEILFMSYPVLCTSDLRIVSDALKVNLITNWLNKFYNHRDHTNKLKLCQCNLRSGRMKWNSKFK